MKKILYILFGIGLFINSGLLYGFNVQTLLEKSAANLSKIKTIKAQIQQEVIINGRSYKYVGSYSAKYPGKFKVTYTYPNRQIFWMEKTILNWYVPSKKLDLYFPNITGQTQNAMNSKPNLVPSLPDKSQLLPDKKYYSVIYSGKKFVSLFKRDHLIQFIPKIKESGLPLIKIYINQKNYTAEKIMIYHNGKLNASQEYSDFKYVDGIYFPTDIIINMPTKKLTTKTHYLRFQLNIPVTNNDLIEKLPTDTIKRKFDPYQTNF